MSAPERIDTVVVGAGQAGLAVGHHLAKRDQEFVILEADERVGDVWRRRFDSLRLFSPARYNGLPGSRFPAPGWHYPMGHEMADYLEDYALRFDLPVRTRSPVERVARNGEGYVVRANGGAVAARNVVVASGTWQEPRTPEFARELDSGITQLHSDDYRKPSQLQAGPALVVGSSHSGADIALELSGAHQTILAGPVRGEIPFRIDGRVARFALPVLWFMANHVLTVRTPIGRKVRPKIRAEGGPLLRVKRTDLEEAGVERTEEKVTVISGGSPVLAGGRVLDHVRNVIWCTGFGKDLGWLDVPVAGEDGWPEVDRGAVESAPGLYFVGLPFLYAFASMLVGGVGRDAKRVAKRIAARS